VLVVYIGRFSRARARSNAGSRDARHEVIRQPGGYHHHLRLAIRALDGQGL